MKTLSGLSGLLFCHSPFTGAEALQKTEKQKPEIQANLLKLKIKIYFLIKS
jgi:hypothetical protein